MKKNLGRYKIMKELGRGAMGIVYQGYDPKIDRVVALKTIRKDRLADSRDGEDLAVRFQEEIRAAGKLVHPNIIIVYDTGEDEETAYVAMEYVEGDTLENLIQRRIRFSREQIIDIFGQICDGLAYTHRRGIVHRDLKPSNIMLVKGKRVKITDFGISKAIGASSSLLKHTSILLGTPRYMSPEQITGKEIDGRSDLFSLGIILYQLLTGESPFQGDNISTLLFNIVNKNPIPPSQVDPTVPPVYDEVITKALAKDPGKRYPTASDFLQDLKRAFHSEDMTEPWSTETTLTAPWGLVRKIYPKRNRLGLLVGLAGFIVILSLGGYWLLFGRKPGLAVQEGVSRGSSEGREISSVGEKGGEPATGEVSRPQTGVSFGTIMVRSHPPNAEVILDGKRISGSTPIELHDISADNAHSITVAKEGYETKVQTVTVKQDERMEVEVALKPLLGEIRISSVPPGAEVCLEGKLIAGTTPTRISALSVGKRYTLRLKKEGYRVWEGVVNLADAEPLEIPQVVLKEAYGSLKLLVFPWADVYHGGRKLGTTPLTHIPLREGSHRLVLKNPPLNIEKEIVVRIREDTLTTKSVNMTAGLVGKLKIKARPWARVYVDGKDRGMTPLTALELPPGEHIVQLENEKLGKKRFARVLIRPNEVHSLEVDLLGTE